ncbi:MAG: citrate lyase acyl carrier protein [Tissierellaceae bacterium]|jgi:citrate lyase subunit gamma (acyl carrier protein)
MDIKKVGIAGTLESSDISITIEPREQSGIEIFLQSSVERQFGKQIRKVIEDILKSHGIESAFVRAIDKGAVDYVIKARTQTALYRAAEMTEYSWEEVM